jgi:hypothetical protein
MTSRSKQLDLNDAEAGMVLSEAVLDAHGGVLLKDATVLNAAILTSLRRRGVETVFVIDDAVSEEDLKAERERVQAQLAHLFRKCRAQGASDALLQSVTEYRTGGA